MGERYVQRPVPFRLHEIRILAASDGMIFPSFTEGFGIPITEGALYSKPVLCSDIEVFREIAGDDAFYFDPYREDTLVAAVNAVIADPQEAMVRAARLKARVLQIFTTDGAAARLKAFLQEAGLAAKTAPVGALADSLTSPVHSLEVAPGRASGDVMGQGAAGGPQGN